MRLAWPRGPPLLAPVRGARCASVSRVASSATFGSYPHACPCHLAHPRGSDARRRPSTPCPQLWTDLVHTSGREWVRALRDELRIHPDDRAERPQGPRPLGRARRAGRLRLRGLERPLLAVADRAGPRPVRVVGARRRRAGHRAGRAHDLRDVPDDALPPGRRRPEGRDDAAARRRPLHPRARQRREPQRARRRRGLAGRRDAAGHARRGDRDHPQAALGRARRRTTATTSTSTPPGSGTCPTSSCPSPSR